MGPALPARAAGGMSPTFLARLLCSHWTCRSHHAVSCAFWGPAAPAVTLSPLGVAPSLPLWAVSGCPFGADGVGNEKGPASQSGWRVLRREEFSLRRGPQTELGAVLPHVGRDHGVGDGLTLGQIGRVHAGERKGAARDQGRSGAGQHDEALFGACEGAGPGHGSCLPGSRCGVWGGAGVTSRGGCQTPPRRAVCSALRSVHTPARRAWSGAAGPQASYENPLVPRSVPRRKRVGAPEGVGRPPREATVPPLLERAHPTRENSLTGSGSRGLTAADLRQHPSSPESSGCGAALHGGRTR